jgi:F0F1-type ATP synthase membrane subunit a
MFEISFGTIIAFYQSPVIFGLLAEVIFILILSYFITQRPDSKFSILFEVVYTKMHAFYLDILWKSESKWVLNYVLSLFCVIFFSNAIGVVLELLAPFFWMTKEGEFLIDHYIVIPSSDINFNLAMAIMSIAVLIYIQIKSAGIGGFFYQFVPFKGKWYLVVERWDMKSYIYYPLSFFAKFFDITISIFLGLLDLTEYAARIVSLSFRLFWNIMSWGVLLGMIFIGLWEATTFLWKWFWNLLEGGFSFLWFPWFGITLSNIFGHNFPVIIPVLLYVEDAMVSFIQAMVFALLISIFIRVAQAEAEENIA